MGGGDELCQLLPTKWCGDCAAVWGRKDGHGGAGGIGEVVLGEGGRGGYVGLDGVGRGWCALCDYAVAGAAGGQMRARYDTGVTL